MNNKTYSLVDDDTGEILVEGIEYKSDSNKIMVNKKTREAVEKLLKKAETLERSELSLLYGYCKKTGKINGYSQCKIENLFRDNDMFKMILEVNFGLHILKCLETANKYSCFMKKSQTTFIETWNDLWEITAITSKTTQQKVKKFLLDNKLVRVYKHHDREGNKRVKFVVNPFLYRNSSFVGQIAVNQFQDYIKEGRNMADYLIKLLEGIQVIDKRKML